MRRRAARTVRNTSGACCRPTSSAKAVPNSSESSAEQSAASIEFQVAFQVLRALSTSRATARSRSPPGAAASTASLTIGQTHSSATTVTRTAYDPTSPQLAGPLKDAARPALLAEQLDEAVLVLPLIGERCRRIEVHQRDLVARREARRRRHLGMGWEVALAGRELLPFLGKEEVDERLGGLGVARGAQDRHWLRDRADPFLGQHEGHRRALGGL